MADDTNDLLKKRIAARAAMKRLNMPTPGASGKFGVSLDDADAYNRDFIRTAPRAPITEEKPPKFADAVAAARDRFKPTELPERARINEQEKLIRGSMERLNEAQGGGLAMFQQLQQTGETFKSQDGTSYYVEPEGKFLIARSASGEFVAIEVGTIGAMLTKQVEQQREHGGIIPRTPEKPKRNWPTLADTKQLIGNLNSRISGARQKADGAKVYNYLQKSQDESVERFVAARSTPERKTLPDGLDAEQGKGAMVREIAQYGREEGKNMVRELREHGGEIVHQNLTYKVDGDTFTRSHGDKLTFDFKADEIEKAVDVRQSELVAIDRWNGQSPALDLQARLAAEIGQVSADEERAMMGGKIAAEQQKPQAAESKFREHLPNWHKLNVPDEQERRDAFEGIVNTPNHEGEFPTDDELRGMGFGDLVDEYAAEEEDRPMTAEQIAADDKRILEERAERDLLPDGLRKQYEHDLLMENTPEEFYRGESEEDFYGDDPVDVYERELQGFNLDASRSEDGPELRAEPGEDYQFSDLDNRATVEDQHREAGYQPVDLREEIVAHLRQQPEGTTFEQGDSQYMLKGKTFLEREFTLGGGQEFSAYHADNPTQKIATTPSEKAWIGDFFQNEELARFGTVEVAQPKDQQSELETLKAQMAQLQEKLATYEQQPQQAQPVASSTPKEDAPQRQQSAEQQQEAGNVFAFPKSPAQEAKLGERIAADQGHGWNQVSDKQVADQIEGRSKGQGADWFSVLDNRKAQREAAGEKIEDKPYVAKARESEVSAAVKSFEQKHSQSPSQSLH
ncbi:hypothetical protein HFO91_30830 [Rhizobium leguminosarum]|uniref:hypothetical protein n=1 Tax=Rhizobium leguminosarum TaxID=384 RepID=UPI001C94EC2B|nr:hypothetical protein [Rhizobium leguminosarum]MBY5453976.1 hypothetical protein [Rhizobium leguminosarum]